ncbi:16S rRNA (adenine(1518)-N(6)/adenine(1519)-N(6))-dimethyltransferase RsmA [Pseudohoeflea coraliihabitans]|uniref:Ribosomal RNA small subunit methyltransferase A n=1 Tax=Pseudohoeflea coraliihabitans TaxID=2860393 RepID=A0ABS6WRW7_9HYPH|nr:16S rRNA (adenine(1518)-N(6)/adenine(1519)-N(6))-dimethyltransferase RsmA [Pseudohoeflea sp. DP4N28-3]MBW3098709.1 16S rRNA (adenine(1518)-N(6)/adenine(1519)-N(6))-dimethyltransferase RsmA [Pseudohoeflea sp. DP4N28-3]
MSLAFDGLPPLREVAAAHGLTAVKALGQNFLFDLNLTQKIARSAGPLAGALVIEIGPGPGGLTRALLAEGAERVIAIERDRRCLPALGEIAAHYPGRLEIIEADALSTDLAALAAARSGGEDDLPVKIVANLPYNIGTQLLLNWLTADAGTPFWSSMTLMFQKEVGQRIVAAAGDKHYGRLGVLAGWLTHAEILFDISPQAFHPPPKVTSSVVHLEPRRERLPCQLASLERITQAAFGQRRKMLRQSLKPVGGERLLNAAEIDPQRRAETLSIAEFCTLARCLDAQAGTSG